MVTKTADTLTIKGKALIAAKNAGLIQRVPDGYDISSFLRFWDLLAPAVHKMADDLKQHGSSMLYDESDYSAYDSRQTVPD